MILAVFIFIYLFLVMSYVYARKQHSKLQQQKRAYQIRSRLYSDEPNPSLLRTTYTSH